MKNQLLPKRTTLSSECARVLSLRIHQGEWPQYLPGERRLAELFQVGRDTIRAALLELEQQGLLLGSKPGTRRKINRSALAQSDLSHHQHQRPLKIGILSPVPIERMAQPLLLEIDHIRDLLAARSGSIHVFSPPWFESQHPDKKLEKLISTEQCSAWLLVRSSQSIQTWFEQSKVPCLIRGYPHPGVILPHLDIDWQATAHHAASTLWRLGHREVGILVPPGHLGGVTAAVAGAHQFADTKPDFHIAELPEAGTVSGIIKMFELMLKRSPRPSALIATRARQVATVLGCAARARLYIPEELSLISLSNELFLEQLLPTVTRYHLAPNTIARQVLRRLKRIADQGNQINPSPWLTPDMIKGASVSQLPS